MLTFDELYSWVRDLPVVDWHNHLDLDMIAADRPLGSLYEVWVKADPYKHRGRRVRDGEVGGLGAHAPQTRRQSHLRLGGSGTGVPERKIGTAG